MAVTSNLVAGQILTASAVNTYMINSGLDYVKSQSIGVNATSVDVTSAFSSTWDDYLVIVNGGTASTSSNCRLKIGAATSQYYSFLNYGTYLTGAVAGAVANNAYPYFDWTGHLSSVAFLAQIEIKSPNLAKYTQVEASFDNGVDVGTTFGTLKDSTQHTGFTITPAGGTLTGGYVTVYGYRKA